MLNRSRSHEQSDMSPKLVFIVGLTLILTIAVMQLVLGVGFFYLKRRMTQNEPRAAGASVIAQRKSPPPPLLQRDPPADYRAYREQQERILMSYEWVDRQSRVVRIPIDRAMEILAHSYENK